MSVQQTDDDPQAPMGDREALQAIIDNPASSDQHRMKAIDLKARLDGKIGHGRGEREPSEMTREELESYLSDALSEAQRRKSKA